MAAERIGVGLIGCGNIGQIHASSLARIASDGVPIRPVIAADPSVTAREAAAHNWPFERLVDDPREVLDAPDVDAVFVCTPTFTHRDLILSTLAAGKHLYAEKPIAPAFDRVKEICDAAAASPVVAQVGFQMRRNAMHKRVKGFVESGDLGPPMCYMMRTDECWPTTIFESHVSDWRSQREFSGGGPLIEHCIHAIDLASWMFGPAVRVSASTRRVFGFDVEDTATLSLEHESGVIGTILSVYGGVEGREECRSEVVFERGIVEVTWGVIVDAEENVFRIQRADEPAAHIDPGAILEAHLASLGVGLRPFFWQELANRDFFESIRTGRPASPGFADARVAHATVQAAYLSAEQKTGVSVTELIGR